MKAACDFFLPALRGAVSDASVSSKTNAGCGVPLSLQGNTDAGYPQVLSILSTHGHRPPLANPGMSVRVQSGAYNYDSIVRAVAYASGAVDPPLCDGTDLIMKSSLRPRYKVP